ncbi:hypothetical protein C0992_004067, partial [Termitomyces sp. T32_za158]
MNAYLPALARESPDLADLAHAPDDDDEAHPSDEAHPTSPLIPSTSASALDAKYTTELSRITSRISSLGIALGYTAGILLLLVALVPVTRLHGSTFSLRLAIGLSGVWWALFTLPAALWLPGAHPTSASASVTASDTPWNTTREISAAWKRLGTMLRPSQIKKLRNTFTYLLAWFLLSDG